MELQDYWVALRRNWTTWLGVTLAGLLVALAAVVVTPPTYQATAQVFVASVDDSTSGSQFVKQRVPSYPPVVDSSTVLTPVIAQLGLSTTFPQLRRQVSATNPVDTSQVDIVVTDRDPDVAAQIANAVAERFGAAVEELEKPGGGASPVNLTVTNPATVPTSPVSPVPTLLLPLGLVVGAALGAAAAVVRSRLDRRLHTADDVRAAWGSGADRLVVHAAGQGRRRSHRPTTLLARQLEPLAEEQPVHVLVLSPAAGEGAPARTVAEEVAAELTSWEVPAEVAEDGSAATAAARAGVRLTVTSPHDSLRAWRRLGADHAGAVLVVEPGRVDPADLQDVRSVLDAAGVAVLAVVLTLPHRRTLRRDGAGAPVSAAPVEPVADAPVEPSVAARTPKQRTRSTQDAVPTPRR